MKFFCSGAELAGASNIVSKAVAVNRNIPLLEGINIKAYGKTVTLSAFNQELYIEKTIPAKIYDEGEIVVNGKLFNDCINKISNVDQIEIERNLENKISIKFGKNSLELNYYESTGFATFGTYDDSNSCLIKECDLKELFERSIFCLSTGTDSRIILKCCSIEVLDGIAESVCLDGFRVAISQKPVSQEKGIVKCVVLGKTISDIIKILTDSEDEVKLVNEKKAMIIDLGHTKIKTTLIDELPFNYRNSIIRNENYEIIVNKEELEGSLTRTSIISRESNNNAVTLTVSNGVMNIFSNNEKGKITENIDCKCDGDEVRISLNNRYLSDAIARIKEDYVKIIIDDNRHPIVVKKIEGNDYRCMILPIKLT